ncbi:endoplasmic reticulum protein [Cyathus striatus]|nr:endoplasmic reticulum protein [Cyathus striatus]
MDALFSPLASAVGASVDQIKLIFCLLVAYPLGPIFVRIPSTSPALRHLFNVAVAVIFFFPHPATYFIAKYDHSKSMPWKVFVVVMGHLTVNHVIRAVYGFSYETMEVTGPQMVLTMKLTTFAWNVFDGRRKAEDLDKWQLSKCVREYPSLLTFLGYSFYYPGILVGPYLTYAEYMDLINETTFQAPAVKAHTDAHGKRLPKGRKRAAYTRMVLGLIYLGIFVSFGTVYHFGLPLDEWFMKHPLWLRIVIFQTVGPVERCKYYAIWTLTEGASILTGLGFTGLSAKGEPQWDGAANVQVRHIEAPENFKVLLDAWNMKTNVWLRECVYKRVTKKGQKPGFGSSMITFGTSAFWHGIASGYYLTFFFGGFITAVARQARQNFRPFFLPGAPLAVLKPIYDIVGIIASEMTLNYAAAPFIILSARKSVIVWSRLGWYGHILIFGGLAFFYLGGTGLMRGLQKSCGIAPPAKKGQAQPVQNGTASGTSSGTQTPVQEKNFMIPPSLHSVAPPEKKVL